MTHDHRSASTDRARSFQETIRLSQSRPYDLAYRPFNATTVATVRARIDRSNQSDRCFT